MRPVDKRLFQDNELSYQPYGKAKEHLILALGDFCSYCERQGYSGNDNLWMARKKSWSLAQRYLNKYQQGSCDIGTIKDLALSNGAWSIWMAVFQTFPEVQQELIDSFPGTNALYFRE